MELTIVRESLVNGLISLGPEANFMNNKVKQMYPNNLMNLCYLIKY